MKQIVTVIAGIALTTALLSSCEDENSQSMGSSLITDEVEVIVDSSFVLTGHSVDNERVQSRTIVQLLGEIEAEGYGRLSSDIVTQYMSANVLDTLGMTVADIDSFKLRLTVYVDGYVGDSLVPMGLTIHPLIKQLPSPIYSDFDPKGYYDPDVTLGHRIYSYSSSSVKYDKTQSSVIEYRYIDVDLPLELGRRFFTHYKNNPDVFSEPSLFNEYFPGVYITNNFGSGRIMQIVGNDMMIYYHQTVNMLNDEGEYVDSTLYRAGNYFAVTPEIVTNNCLRLNLAQQLTDRADAGEAVIVAPVGRDVQITFPAREIVDFYQAKAGESAVVNSLSLSIPSEKISNEFGIAAPPYLLMVRSDKKDEFFADNNVTDNITSFYASVDTVTGTYTFDNMRSYILDLLSKKEIDETDYTFTLTPVAVTTERVSDYSSAVYVSNISPLVSFPAMVNLDLEKSKIKFTFSKQTIKN